MLKTRLITSAILIPSFFAALFFTTDFVWALLMLLISLVALYEWSQMFKFKQSAALIYLVISLGFCVLVLCITRQFGSHWLVYRSLDVFIVACVFWVLAVPVLLYKNKAIRQPILQAIIGWILILPLWLALICLKIADPWLLLGLAATVWIADSAAYFVGKLLGKHKLAPSISPGKTWEGVMGGLLIVTLYGLILVSYFKLPILATLIILWSMTILSVMGDLFESMMKRQANIKDSGKLLPGHGGILDRVDGLTSSLPVAVLMIFIYSLFKST